MKYKTLEELKELTNEELENYLKSMTLLQGKKYNLLLEKQGEDIQNLRKLTEQESIILLKVRNEPILKKFNKATEKLKYELEEYVKKGLLKP